LLPKLPSKASTNLGAIQIQDVTIAGSMPFDHWLFYIFPGFRMLEFLSGMILFHLWRNGFVARRILFPVSIIFTALLISVAAEIPEEFRYSLLYLPAVCLVLWSSLSLDGWCKKLLSSKAAVLLGNASFAFYLIHVPIIRVLKQETMLGWMLDGGWIFQFGFLLASLGAVTAASILLHMLYDEPVGKFLRKQVVRSTSPGAPQTAGRTPATD
jgi:peptidoglycan/LPS O-acetylase OafA/YrhL